MRGRRSFSGVLLGFTVAVSVGTLYLLSNKAVKEGENNSTISESKIPSYSVNSSLDFSSVDNFASSLSDVLGSKNAYRLELNQVYNVENETTLAEYKTEDNALTVIVDNLGKIICCKFVTDDDMLKQGIKSSISSDVSSSSFAYKDVLDGFVLEA